MKGQRRQPYTGTPFLPGGAASFLTSGDQLSEMAEAGARDPAATGELTATDPSLRDRLADLLSSGLEGLGLSPYAARERGQTGTVGLDFAPFVGSGMALDEAQREYEAGNYGMAALNAASAVPEVGPAAKAMILGLGSRFMKSDAGKAAVQEAERLMAEGASQEDILKQTGVFQQHGDWKHEISDREMTYSDAALDALLGNEGQFKGYLGPSPQLELWGEPKPGLIEHPELFEQHPELADMPVDASIQFGRAGSFMPGEGIKAEGRHTQDLLGTLAHETQHAAQYLSNTPRGGSPKDPTLVKDMAAVKDTADVELTKLQEERRAYPGTIRQWNAENPDKSRRYNQLLETVIGPGGSTTGYQHLAGEVEARNVARRRDMTAEERAEELPWQTQDLPDDLQIVRRRKTGPMSTAEMRDEMAETMVPGMQGMKAAEPLAAGRISQRVPTAVSATESPSENLLINTEVLKSDPKRAQQASDLIATYPGTTPEMLEMNPAERIDAQTQAAKANILALYDLMPPEARERSSQWYHGANRIAGERAAEVGIDPAAAAGTYAALSPQKDWFQNVYLGDQVLRTLAADPKITPDMMRLAETLPAYAAEPQTLEMTRGLEGRRLSNMTPTEQALAVRLASQSSDPRHYSAVTPEGGYGDLVRTKAGEPARAAWSAFGDVEKAINAAMSGGDPAVISEQMGGAHKVRNFYNNIVAPTAGAPFGDITADTHQIAAGLMRPLSGSSPEVMHGLGTGAAGIPKSSVTGLSGLYPIYADATRMAAAERGVPTIAMQSTPWEAIRSLYPSEARNVTSRATADEIWRAFGRGEISREEAQRRIVLAAGGFSAPTWGAAP